MSEKRQEPSPDQTRAVKERGKNLLVSAAAGSGKTYTLVERIITNIVDGTYNIDELLVLTFTNAAAAEMRERIEKRITARLKTDPTLERQLALLPNASISTIHVFCLSLIRQHFAALDMDPGFRVANEQEIELVRRQVMEELFEERYEAQDGPFLQFVAQYGSDRGDEKLHEMILQLYDFSRSQPEPEAWLEKQPEMFNVPEGTPVKELLWYKKEIQTDIFRVLEKAENGVQNLLRRVALCGADELSPALEADAAQLAVLRDAADRGWEELAAAIRIVKYQRQPAAKNVDKAFREFISAQRKNEIKDRVAYLKETYFSESAQQLIKDLRECRPAAAALCGLAQAFGERFEKTKRKKRIVDFSDLEHFALRLLQDDAVARALRGRYREVMVDEYQDVNGVQEAILQRVANGRNLFAVGDVKQSIYRFRLADPGLFQAKHTDYARGENEESDTIDMKENYRSRKEILAAVNYVFSQVMVAPGLELDYDEKAALYAKADYPAGEAGSFADEPTELYILEEKTVQPALAEDDDEPFAVGSDEMKGFGREAAFLADKVRQLYQEGRQIYDKEEERYRPLRWRDMAVLLRSTKGKAQTLVEAFRVAQVPAYAAVDAGYFEEVEIGLILALLSVIDNAHQDIPLAAVLHSSIGGMDANELAEIRAEGGEESHFYSALAASQNAKAKAFVERLRRWRTLSRRVGVPELLWQLYRETGYYDYVGAQPGGLVRQANLRMLCDRAADYERTNFRGLFRFLQFIRQMRDRDTDLAAARTLGEKEDVVRVMTVHKSKGLEFPVVFLADLGKSFNMRDTKSDLLLHRELGMGLYHNDSDGVITWRYPTLARHAVASRLRRENKAEEMRALYVAMTRAREKLILTASLPSLPRGAIKWCRTLQTPSVAIPDSNALEADSWLDWIGMALARHPEGGAEIREAAGEDDFPVLPYDHRRLGTSCWQVKIVLPPSPSEKEKDEAEDEWLGRLRRCEKLAVPEDPTGLARLDWKYAYPFGIPAKITVTELKRRQDEREFEDADSVPLSLGFHGEKPDFLPPAFLRDEAEAKTGTAYGTLMHDVLQRLALDDLSQSGAIREQLAAMAATGRMTPEEAERVDVEALAAFGASSLGQRARRAKRVWREQAFGLLLPAREIVPEAAAEDEVYLQGVIDLFFEESDGKIVLVDYKTDRKTTPEVIRRRYQKQLALYNQAIQRIIGKAAEEVYVYRLFDGDAVRLASTMK